MKYKYTEIDKDALRLESQRQSAFVKYKSHPISSKSPPQKLGRIADHLWAQYLARSPLLKKYKLREKQIFWRKLYKTTVELGPNEVIRFSRNSHHDRNEFRTAAEVQVIDCAVEQNLYKEIRSKAGGNRSSRLIPNLNFWTDKMVPDFLDDDLVYVELKARKKSKERLPIDNYLSDPDHLFSRTQIALEKVNGFLKLQNIVYHPYDEVDKNDWVKIPRKLHPVHYAIFVGNSENQGRLYTKRYGHQGLKKLERRTIEINGKPCVELDFRAMHCIMLYHLAKIDYKKDPYRLWDDKTTPHHRVLAKHVVNTLINVRWTKVKLQRKNLISACERAVSLHKEVKEGKWVLKKGKELQQTMRLLEALEKTRLAWSTVYNKAIAVHKPLKNTFGQKGIGNRLMRLDSQIAIEIMVSLVEKSIPVLGCHDSFIVPLENMEDLRTAMLSIYRKNMGFLPLSPSVTMPI